MSKSDSQELNEILKNAPDTPSYDGDGDGDGDGDSNPCFSNDIAVCGEPVASFDCGLGGYCQWSTSDGKRYIPSRRNCSLRS